MLPEAEVDVPVTDAGELPPVGRLLGLLPQLPEAQTVERFRIGEVALVEADAALRGEKIRSRWKVGAIGQVDGLDDFANEGCWDSVSL